MIHDNMLNECYVSRCHVTFDVSRLNVIIIVLLPCGLGVVTYWAPSSLYLVYAVGKQPASNWFHDGGRCWKLWRDWWVWGPLWYIYIYMFIIPRQETTVIVNINCVMSDTYMILCFRCIYIKKKCNTWVLSLVTGRISWTFLLQKVLNEKVRFGAVCCKNWVFRYNETQNHEMNAQILFLDQER